jgi:hypothetical protein
LIYGKDLIENKKDIKRGFIFLRHTAVIKKKLMDDNYIEHDIKEYSSIFNNKCKIYANGGAMLMAS